MQQSAENQIFKMHEKLITKEKGINQLELDDIKFQVKYSKRNLSSLDSPQNFEEILENRLFLSPCESVKSIRAKDNLSRNSIKLDSDLRQAENQIEKMQKEIDVKNSLIREMHSKMNVEMFEKKRIMQENKEIFAEKLEQIRGPTQANFEQESMQVRMRPRTGKFRTFVN